jgi:hypothetical protein
MIMRGRELAICSLRTTKETPRGRRKRRRGRRRKRK